EQTKANYEDANVAIYAPEWVEKSLQTLSPYFSGKSMIIKDTAGGQITHTFGTTLTLRDLQMLARNESINTSGEIGQAAGGMRALYGNLLQEMNEKEM